VAASSGLVRAFHHTLWIEAGVLVVTAALVCLLPQRARPGTHDQAAIRSLRYATAR